MEAALIVFIIFGSITVWVRGFPSVFGGGRSSKHRERKLVEQLEASTAQVKALQADNAKYETRLQTLESIVCDVDYDLNRKLVKLATQSLASTSSASSGSARATTGLSATVLSDPLAADAPRARGSQGPESFAGELVAGTRIADRFVIERLLGAGAMGEVYAAHDETLHETVALKVMAGISLLERDAVERFKREATAARRITHPNVVRLHDLGVDRGVHFLSMEYVRGQSLRQRIDREVVLNLSDVRVIVAQVCDALTAAHAAGVVHRDLKPDNVLIDEAGVVRVIDFGVAKLPERKGMTLTGVVMGTPEYMSPEQVKGEPVDGRSDLYALGAILFHVLTGSPPFLGSSPIAIGMAHCTEPLPSLKQFRDVPDAWDALVQRAMAKKASERFPTAAELKAALPSV